MRITVKVVPNSGRQEVVEVEKDTYKVFLKKTPKENKANEELIKLLSRRLKKKVRIVTGKTSRKKTLELQ